MREGMLHIRDVEGPKKTGSMETRLEAMEQQVFKCQGMVERGLNANHMMIIEFTNKHRIDANDIGKHLSRLYDRIDQLQAQIYDLQNQNLLSDFLNHALHLDPRYLVLLSPLEFLCEAFVGVTPSVALLCHLFSLELTSEVQCYGCTSLRTVDSTTPKVLYVELFPEAEGFRWQWVQVEAAEAGARFQPPPTPVTPNWGWERIDLSDPRLAQVLIRLEKLRHAGVTMAMVVREFICRWIAPF
ncbi:40S ribosomal protein S5-1 [Hordeum vulgare]|nr:40S ribosomal protein S5-1 [Hordeum vulgare]